MIVMQTLQEEPRTTVPRDLKIGARIRQLRRDRQMTLQQLADLCHCTKSLLSKIENNKAMPAIGTLVTIAESLGSDVGELIEQKNAKLVAFSDYAAVDNDLVHVETGYRVFPFAQKYKHKKMQPFLFVARKGEVKEHHVRHSGEEFIYVLKGKMRFQVGENEYTLAEGDSLYFQAIEQHQVIPITNEVRYLDIFAP